MTGYGWIALVLLTLAVIALYLRGRVLARAEHLNSEVVRTAATMENALRLRALAALELARSPHVDPATAVILADAAGQCLERFSDDAAVEHEPAHLRDHAFAQSELTRALRVIVSQLRTSDSPELLGILDKIERRWQQATMARTVHNSRVTQALNLRNSLGGRLWRVRTPVPVTFDMDDAMEEV